MLNTLPIGLWPPEGITIVGTTPTFVWESAPAEGFELWINGFKQETLDGRVRSHTPFPLAFGPQEWYVVALRPEGCVRSAPQRFTVDDAPLATLPADSTLLRQGWKLQSSHFVGTNGEDLSSRSVTEGKQAWHSTSLPTTVLGALVREGVYPNPYVFANVHRIPDAHDGYNETYNRARFSHIPGVNPWKGTWWFCRDMTLDPIGSGKRVWLQINEINYRAEVWVNGKCIANKEAVVGIDRRFRLDLSQVVQAGENHLAIGIHQLDEVGSPDLPRDYPLAHPGRNMGADTAISVNYTKWDAIGWDWQPAIPDRDIGILEDVWLCLTDTIELAHPYVTAEVLPDGQARLRAEVSLVNHGDAWEGELTLEIADDVGGTLLVTQWTRIAASIEGSATQSIVVFDAQHHPALLLASPRLWWPAGLGKASLYTANFRADGKTLHAEVQTTFGIRKIESWIHPSTKTRAFKINGQPLYGQGGNWVADMLLSASSSKLANEIAAAAHSRINFLRVWGPTTAPPQAFFDAADREGLLIQQDFLNDYWGTDRNSPGACPELEVFTAASSDIIRRFRNHPSLFLWCGGNEGPNPREALLRDELLPSLDPFGQRHYLLGSDKDGLQGGGPYHNLPPEDYWNHPKIRGFNSEIGPSGIPVWESLEQFLHFPPETWYPDRFPLDAEWSNHDATERTEDTRKFSALDTELRRRFGSPVGHQLPAAIDYVAKAQLLNHDTYRAVIESLNSGLWEQSSGYALWKFNSSWPSVTWQLTDWYLRQHAGTYAHRRALEELHVQLNHPTGQVVLVNRSINPQKDLSVVAELLWPDGERIDHWTSVSDAKAQACTPTSLRVPAQEGVVFLRLLLTDKQGVVRSRNVYWLRPTGDFKSLADLPQPTLRVESVRPRRLKLHNAGLCPALMIQLRLVDRQTGVEVLPTLWDDNWFHLMPGETAEVGWSAPTTFSSRATSVLVNAQGWSATLESLDD